MSRRRLGAPPGRHLIAGEGGRRRIWLAKARPKLRVRQRLPGRPQAGGKAKRSRTAWGTTAAGWRRPARGMRRLLVANAHRSSDRPASPSAPDATAPSST